MSTVYSFSIVLCLLNLGKENSVIMIWSFPLWSNIKKSLKLLTRMEVVYEWEFSELY